MNKFETKEGGLNKLFWKNIMEARRNVYKLKGKLSLFKEEFFWEKSGVLYNGDYTLLWSSKIVKNIE